MFPKMISRDYEKLELDKCCVKFINYLLSNGGEKSFFYGLRVEAG